MSATTDRVSARLVSRTPRGAAGYKRHHHLSCQLEARKDSGSGIWHGICCRVGGLSTLALSIVVGSLPRLLPPIKDATAHFSTLLHMSKVSPQKPLSFLVLRMGKGGAGEAMRDEKP